MVVFRNFGSNPILVKWKQLWIIKKDTFFKKKQFKNLFGKKNRFLKKIQNELLKTKLELQNTQKTYKMNILYMFLGCVGIGSFLGMMYTISLMDAIYQEMLYQICIPGYGRNSWFEQQLDKLTTQAYGFAFVFFLCLLTDMVISLYKLYKN